MVFSNTANNWPADSLFMVASMCVLDVLNPQKKISGDKTNLQEMNHACTFFTMLFCVCVSYSLAVLAVRQIINKYFLLNIENGQKNSKFSKLMLFREIKVAKSNSGEHFWYQFVICI